MYLYLILAMVLLAGPVYVIVAKRQSIAHAEPWITTLRVAILVVCGGESGLLFALGLAPTTGFSYGLIVLVSYLSAGAVCSVLMKYEELGRTTSCRIGLAIGLAVSFAVAPIYIPMYIDGQIKVLLDSRSSADERAGVLDQLGDVAIDLVIEALSDDDSNVRKSAADVLGRLGDRRGVDPLIEALADNDWGVRWRAATALGLLGDERGADPLIEALADNDWRVRYRAAEALGRLGDKRGIDPLIGVLADDNYGLRDAAREALKKLGHRE